MPEPIDLKHPAPADLIVGTTVVTQAVSGQYHLWEVTAEGVLTHRASFWQEKYLPPYYARKNLEAVRRSADH